MPVWMMREHVQKAYSGEKWRQKVERMSDSQILAIFQRLQQSGKIKI